MNPSFRTTVFRFTPPPGGVPRRFGIVTAWNPHDQPVDLRTNEAADQALAARLSEEGWPHFRVTGCSPDLSHSEPGFGVVTSSPEEAVELGRWFAQAAVYWVEEDEILLIDCRVPEPERVGRWSERAGPEATRS